MGNYSFNGCHNGSICGILIHYFEDLEFQWIRSTRTRKSSAFQYKVNYLGLEFLAHSTFDSLTAEFICFCVSRINKLHRRHSSLYLDHADIFCKVYYNYNNHTQIVKDYYQPFAFHQVDWQLPHPDCHFLEAHHT